MITLLAEIPFFPEAASNIAPQVDAIFWTLTAVSAFMTLGLFVVITGFLIRYRANSEANRVMSRLSPTYLEVTWTAIPIFLFTGLFVWGAVVYVRASKPPPGAMPIYVVGQQWYWDIRHENGSHEIGDLHVPVDRPVQLIMTSADVIHDYFIPAFRIKRDVVPGKYTTQWFIATKPGQYRVLCNQYCGTSHSEMTGTLYAMRADDYQRWLESTKGARMQSMAETGARLFRRYSCSGCHGQTSGVHAPELEGIYGHAIPLEGGQYVTADDQYLRDAILRPSAEVVAGYKPIMPSYQGQISEEDVMAIIAYIKSLSQSPASVPIPPSQ